MPIHQQAVVWVYIDLAKEALTQKKQEEVADYIDAILCLPFYTDTLLCQQVYWLIVRFIWHTNISLPKSQALLARLLHFPCPEESKLIDALLNTALKVQADWASFLPFLVWARIETLQKSAEIERFIKPVTNALLAEKDNGNSFSYIFYTFFEWIEGVQNKYPELMFAPYYLAKIYVLLNQKENALVLAKKLVQNKKNDFWTWQLLARCVDDAALRLALLVKAISLGGKEEMLFGLRQELTNCLIMNNNWEAAKHQILCMIDVRNKNNWKILATICAWQKHPAYQNARGKELNYKAYTPIAEDFVFQENPKVPVVISKLDMANNMAYYFDKAGNGGKFCFKKLGFSSIKVGECFDATMAKHPTKDYLQIVRISKTNNFDWVKDFKAPIIINALGIGFADGIYISSKLVAEMKLRSNTLVEGIAILGYDAKKNSEGWRAITVLAK